MDIISLKLYLIENFPLPCLKHLKSKCNKALQLIPMVAPHTEWGADLYTGHGSIHNQAMVALDTD